jgi:hypothetical protein
VFVLEVEGYPKLLTTHDNTAAVLTAYASTDWSAATVIRGMKRPGVYRQSITPMRPEISSGSMAFRIVADDADTFGIDTSLSDKTGGNWARLDANADSNDVGMTWGSTADLAASGSLYLGTEKTAYTGKTSTTTTGHTRGQNAPHAVDGGTRFGRPHRVSRTAGTPVSFPYGTDWPHKWVGRMVGCRAFRVLGTVLDVRSESELIFAGRIADIEDDGSGETVITCTDAIEMVASSVLLGDQFSAVPGEGVTLAATDFIEIREVVSTGFTETVEAEQLIVGTGGYIDTGIRTADEVVSGINNFLLNSGTGFNAEWSCTQTSQDHAKFRAIFSGTLIKGRFVLVMSPAMAGILGMDLTSPDGLTEVSGFGDSVYWASEEKAGTNPVVTYVCPLKLAYSVAFPQYAGTLNLASPSGTWIDQGNEVPLPWRTSFTTTTGSWGFLRYGDWLMLAKYTSDIVFTTYWDEKLLGLFGTSDPRTGMEDPDDFGRLPSNEAYIRVGDELPNIKQVIFQQGPLENILLRLFASTGTATYNHATYDAYDYQLGAGIPWGLLGASFEQSVNQLSDMAPTAVMSLLLEKPTKLKDVLIPEMQLRNAHLVWKNGTLRFAVPGTTVASLATYVLTKSNKASSPDAVIGDQASAKVTRDMLVTHIKIAYNRDWQGKYHDVLEINNEQSATDYGGTEPLTIEARNTLGFGGGADAIQTLGAMLAGEALKFFDHPLLTVTRSIGPALYGIAPFDTVSASDNHVRSPFTGARGISVMPGFALGVSWDFTAMRGEVGCVLLTDDTGLRTVYSPAAEVDDTAAGTDFGYASAGPYIWVKSNIFTMSGESDDVSHFAVSDDLSIVAKSPATPASPTVWSRDIVAIGTGANANRITLSSTLTSPAWDNTLKYYVTSQVRSSSEATQQTDAYIGDDADGKILNVARNNRWGNQPSDSWGVFPAPITTDLYEFPNDSASDGGWDTEDSPCTPAMHRAAVRAANNLNNRRTAPCLPILFQTQESFTSVAYVIVMLPFPFFIGSLVSDTHKRQINAGPRLQRTAGAGTITLKITASNLPPRGTTMTAPTYEGATTSQTWTHASATATNVTRKQLEIPGGPSRPYVWLTVEALISGLSTGVFQGLHELWLGPWEAA